VGALILLAASHVVRVAFLLVAPEDQILSAAQQVVLVWLLSASIEVDRVARVAFLLVLV
jgi:hypothetical protein